MLPQRNTSVFSESVYLKVGIEGSISLSNDLTSILVSSRENYDWPSGTGSKESQENIIALEEEVAELYIKLNPNNAKQIISKVSIWGGNNKISQNQIDDSNEQTKEAMFLCLNGLFGHSSSESLVKLSNISGIGLVMATKVYRFCRPDSGADLDRHSSYFFNSLPLHSQSGEQNYSTSFRREWSTGRHTTSRLAAYQNCYFEHNLHEYINRYLHTLMKIANSLNQLGVTYKCAATGKYKQWKPADVEMAAYF